MVIRYARSGGSRDHLFVHSFPEFEALLASLPPLADVVVFRKRQLPIRGLADKTLLELALKEIPDGEWWFLLCRRGEKPHEFSSDGSNSHRDLKAAFEEYQGKYACVGPDSPFQGADDEDMQSGVIPLADGSTPPAAY